MTKSGYTLIIFLVLFYSTAIAQTITYKADSIRIKYGVPELAFAVVSVDKILDEQYLGYQQNWHKLKN